MWVRKFLGPCCTKSSAYSSAVGDVADSPVEYRDFRGRGITGVGARPFPGKEMGSECILFRSETILRLTLSENRVDKPRNGATVHTPVSPSLQRKTQ